VITILDVVDGHHWLTKRTIRYDDVLLFGAIIHFDVPHRRAIDVAPGERRVVKIGLN